MNEAKTDWGDLQLFLAVARAGGLSSARAEARRSPATLGRRIAKLERQMEVELFVRHDRGYALTEEGRHLFERLSDLEPRLAALEDRSDPTAPRLVKVSAGTWTTLALLDRLDDILGDPPDVRLRFVANERSLSISHREVLIGFRNRQPTEAVLAGRRLSRVEFAAYARADAPDCWIMVIADTPSARWLRDTASKRASCEVNTPRNGLDLALAGRGKALLPTFIGDRQPQLVRRGPKVAELAHDQWLVAHHDDRHLPEVRRVIDRFVRAVEGRATTDRAAPWPPAAPAGPG